MSLITNNPIIEWKIFLNRAFQSRQSESLFSGKHVKKRGAGIKKCPVCKETFEFRSFLIKHLRTNHEDFKIYDCSQCDKNFLTLQGQMYHMFHNHERKIRCEISGFCLLLFCQNERIQLLSFFILFEESVFIFQFLSDKIHDYVKQNITFNF